MSVVGSDPTMVLEGPIPATEKVLAAAGMTIGDIDLYEVNEAFGSVPLAWMKAVGADYDKLNVNGGAQALGTRWVHRYQADGYPDLRTEASWWQVRPSGDL